uniref:Uncharacterized protein n=1 Tax=Neogobius melanostomus TaxID=47308 RepID=A0A8C6TBT5_9GOBI
MDVDVAASNSLSVEEHDKVRALITRSYTDNKPAPRDASGQLWGIKVIEQTGKYAQDTMEAIHALRRNSQAQTQQATEEYQRPNKNYWINLMQKKKKERPRFTN